MTPPKIIPVKIRPHLIPFLFKEFEGKQASYDFRTVKYVSFLPSSSITSYLYTHINYIKNDQRQDKFLFHFIINHQHKKTFEGNVFIDKSGVKEQLYMSEQKVRDFNNLLEDMFRMAMVFHVDACVDYAKLSVPKAIELFIQKYDLYEAGLDDQALRVLYFRQKKTTNLYRFQSKSANRVFNYA